ncbi:peptidase [Streptomyces sp. NA02950]|uniref:Clp protease N-terminal domain-containing protein n=1 Tax=Streptomyces sp. NA02950 TaxID=2742137 RepID=UPI001590B4AC|nr:Clp protease N-terminal domain-containing protein [Streptomyces sp. NA02950]QKV91289.1 peptidase [Streptomyces sp. NA02950]
MRSRTLSSGAAAGFEARLGGCLTAVVAGARRRAVRDGDKHIDTAHLLHSLVESDPRVRDAFAGGPPQVVRLLGYLVQRTIGYGLRWSGTVEESGAGRAGVAGVRYDDGGRDDEAAPVASGWVAPGWSPAAAVALESAVRRAAARGVAHAHGPDLFAALLRDRGCRAVEVLRRAGVEVEALVMTVDGDICQQSTG